jgi:hypothetical protein
MKYALAAIVAASLCAAVPASAEDVGVGVGVGPGGVGVTVGESHRDRDRDRDRTTIIKEHEPRDKTIIREREREPDRTVIIAIANEATNKLSLACQINLQEPAR